jgi:hypothetical protein
VEEVALGEVQEEGIVRMMAEMVTMIVMTKKIVVEGEDSDRAGTIVWDVVQ